MEHKMLGRTGIEISRIGLGGAQLGLLEPNAPIQQYIDNKAGTSFMNERAGIETVVAALKAGVTLIDTAPLYGAGGSEIIIRKAFRGHKALAKNCLVTTKIGHTLTGDKYNFSYDDAMRSVDCSMERLNVDRFRILYLHDPMNIPMQFVMGPHGVMEALRTLQRMGTIDFIGIAADNPETAADYLETGEFDVATVSNSWSLLNQQAANRILPAARKHNVGLVITNALERGILATGEPMPGMQYLARTFTPEIITHVARIKELCEEFDIPILAAALQWATREPQITTVIPGARTAEEAIINAAAIDIQIPDDFWIYLHPLVHTFPELNPYWR